MASSSSSSSASASSSASSSCSTASVSCSSFSGSSPPLSVGSELLSAAQADADRRDREAMNLKLEIAHLRERLLMRVGGDASAAELEAENFALKTSLMDAQEAAAQRQRALQALDAKYAKALRNLVKMDHAWKSSAAELQHVKKQTQERDAAIRRLHNEREQLAKAHESEMAKRQTLTAYQSDKIAALEASGAAKDAALAAHADQLHAFALKAKELESELETTRKRHESGRQQSVARDEYDALQTRHQQSLEESAALRGETNALRDERAALQAQLGDTKASLTAAMAKFLQLKEENATLDVRVAAALARSEQSARDAAFFKSEVDRIQSELSKRDDETLQLERGKQVLELQLAQQQRLAEDAVLVRDHEAKRLELKQELTWKDREFTLEKNVRALTQQCDALRADAEATRRLHDELCGLLLTSAATDASATTDASPTRDLKTLVAQVLAQHAGASHAAQQQQRHVARLEKQVARMTALAEENATLKAEYEKTRTAMERMVGRKSKATANQQRFRGGATPATGAASAATAASSSFASQRRPIADKENRANVSTSSSSSSNSGGTKRKLELPAAAAGDAGALFSPRSKRVVHVASRYLQATGQAKR